MPQCSLSRCCLRYSRYAGNGQRWYVSLYVEEALEQTIKKITAKDDDTKIQLSRTFTIKNLHRADTISTLKKKQST